MIGPCRSRFEPTCKYNLLWKIAISAKLAVGYEVDKEGIHVGMHSVVRQRVSKVVEASFERRPLKGKPKAEVIDVLDVMLDELISLLSYVG